MAETVADIFTEVIIAPAYEPGAVEVLARKKNIRVLVASEPQQGGTEFRQISGGLLLQQRDALDAPGDDPVNWTLATGSPADPDDAGRPEVRVADVPRGEVQRDRRRQGRRHRRRRHGSGQPRRRGPAGGRAGGDRVHGAVAASDAFFPFPDGLETLTEAGVKAIVHPGGSMRDDIVTEAAAKAGITLYLTGARHFAH